MEYPYIDKIASKNDIKNLEKEMNKTIQIIRNYSNELHETFSKRRKKTIIKEKDKLKYIKNKLEQIR